MRTFLTALGTLGSLVLTASPVRSSVGAMHTGGTSAGEDGPVTAASYVQDGLVSMWDGEENVGWGLHQDNPSYWVDLVGEDSIGQYGAASSAYPFWFNDFSLVAHQYWKNPKSTALYNALVGNNRTVEVVFTRSGSGNCVGFHEFCSGNWANIAGYIGVRLLVYHEGNGFYVDPPTTVTPYAMSVTLAVENGTCYVYSNGSLVAVKNSNGMSVPGNGRLFFGMNLNLVNNSNYFAIWTHSIRVYGRTLSASEVAENFKVDRGRFGL